MTELPIDRAEVLRYMRMGCSAPDAELTRRLDAIERAVRAAARPQAYWRLEKVVGPVGRARESTSTTGAYRIGSLVLESEKLWKVIEGCEHAFLFCATLGAGVDQLLRRTAQMSAADLLMVQATSTALIESYCDACEREMAKEVQGETLRMRFSPGYGDLPLAVQRPFLAQLDAQKRVGITLTDTLLMVPSKSVTAIIGAGVRD